MDNARKVLNGIARNVEHLLAIIITDRDGVPMLKSDYPSDVTTRPQFLSVHGVALEQAAKLGFGEAEYAIFYYNQYQLVLLNYQTVMVTLVATSDANSGQLVGLSTELEPLVKQLRSCIGDVVHNA
ncbi:unnamed protein product [Soboliphyme baturini]|uniref:Robl_LC7 domain-containing protein n=1 Tax=Soboliphyme baturini TaxID=241478 RepID=A0A183ILD1_9BILA|nr:unnamed protein product [Soboliphyme baturini]